MSMMAYQITRVLIVYSTICSGTDKKLQSSVSQAFLRGIHRSPLNSPHKEPVTQKMFPLDDIIILCEIDRLFSFFRKDFDYPNLSSVEDDIQSSTYFKMKHFFRSIHYIFHPWVPCFSWWGSQQTVRCSHTFRSITHPISMQQWPMNMYV